MTTVFTEKKLSTKARNNLPENKFGLPDIKGYPIHDRNHVRMAIVMFHNAKPEHREELAKNIKAQADKFSITIGSKHPIHGYLENNKPNLHESSTDGLVKYLMDAIPDRPEHNAHHMTSAGFNNYDDSDMGGDNGGYDKNIKKEFHDADKSESFGDWAQAGDVISIKENSKTVVDSTNYNVTAHINRTPHEIVNIDYDRAIFMGKGAELVEYHKKRIAMARSPAEKAKAIKDTEKLISALEKNNTLTTLGKGAVIPVIVYPIFSIVMAAGAVALVFGAAVVAAGSVLTLVATPFMSAKGIYNSFEANQARKQHIYELKKLIK